jgi:hypothetical protein
MWSERKLSKSKVAKGKSQEEFIIMKAGQNPHKGKIN